MITLPLSHCSGLDTRQMWDDEDRWNLDTCDNVQILPGGSLSCRPALVKVCDLSSSSFGLYVRGSFLRAVVASGQSLQITAPFGSGVVYDGIGRGGSFNYTGKIDKVVAAETFGVGSAGPYGYIAILRADNGLVEHHWIKDPPVSSATYLSTYVSLPFTPGRALLKIQKKMCADDPANGYLRHCSPLDPTDWTTTGLAGFEAALQFVNGAREIVGFGVHRGTLAVIYADAVQLWHMDPAPANILPLEVMAGTGTGYPRSAVNVYGDLHYLGDSGFSSLGTARDSGQANYTDIGDVIRTLTAAIAAGALAVALFSQRRSQYLCAVGATVYCFSIYPKANEKAWTTWTLPVSVEAMAELAGVVYVRSANVLYRLDDTVGRDSGVATDIAWSWRSRELGGKARNSALIKSLHAIVPQCTASATWTPVCDGRTLTAARVTIPGGTRPIRAHFTGSGRRVAVSCSGTGLMRCDGVVLGAEVCGV